MDSTFNLVVKWSGKEFHVESLTQSDTVGTLKDVIRKLTGVLPERQKLLNLKYKGENELLFTCCNLFVFSKPIIYVYFAPFV